MSNFKDVTGYRFGRLTVLYRYKGVQRRDGKARWVCLCDCGKITEPIYGTFLRTGKTVSCGCYKNDKIAETGRKNKKENVFIKNDENVGLCYDPYGKNFLFFFDWEDLETINKYCWHLGTRMYVHSTKRDVEKIKLIQLHRLIMSVSKNIDYDSMGKIDHIDGNPQNNVKNNLRIVTAAQNMMNRKVNKNSRTSNKGIYVSKSGNFVSVITVNRKDIYLGTYKNIEDAISARKKAEIEYFGEYRNK